MLLFYKILIQITDLKFGDFTYIYEFKIVFFIRMNILVHIYIPHIKMTQKMVRKRPTAREKQRKKLGVFSFFF